MAIIEVVTTSEASKILGVSIPTVRRLISEHKITTAFERCADGYVGRPGYGMYRYEIEALAEKRKQEASELASKKKVKQVKSKTNNKNNILNALEELQTCLCLLNDTIENLKKELT